jgi:release factor glutamine methyltransferase
MSTPPEPATRPGLPAHFDEWLRSGDAQDTSTREALLRHHTGASRADLICRPETPLSPALAQTLTREFARYQQGEPLSYIIGRQAFHEIELQVDARALAPRPETELLVDAAHAALRERFAATADRPLAVADLGTGSGAIALAVWASWPDRDALTITATDNNPQALALAKSNATALGAAVRFACGSWFEPLAQARFHLLLSNPPYLAASDPHLPQLIAEPQDALVAGAGGLADLQHLAGLAPTHLYPGGWLIVEHGAEQGLAVRELFAAAGFRQIETLKDYAGHERLTRGQQ